MRRQEAATHSSATQCTTDRIQWVRSKANGVSSKFGGIMNSDTTGRVYCRLGIADGMDFAVDWRRGLMVSLEVST